MSPRDFGPELSQRAVAEELREWFDDCDTFGEFLELLEELEDVELDEECFALVSLHLRRLQREPFFEG